MHVIVFTWGFLVKWRLSHVQLKGQWNVLNEIKCYLLIMLMYMPNTCRLVWNKNYMLSEISVKVSRSSRKLVGPAETDIV
jgi:hypothetical protein